MREPCPSVPRLVPFAQGVDSDGPFEKYQVSDAGVQHAILGGGLLTPQLGYNGLAPGPTIELERGTRAEVTVRNHLPATHPTFGHTMELATHLHGSASLPQFDGYAADLTAPGFMKTYHYPNHQPARIHLVPRPHAARHLSERLLRLGRALPHPR